VDRLASQYFERMIQPRYQHPERVQSLLTKDIGTHIGKRLAAEVLPMEIDLMLKAIRRRGAPTIANDILSLTKQMFNYAIKRHITTSNPASAFDIADAGGEETARDRALSRPELARLFEAMRSTKGFSIQNHHTFKLLLILAVRKAELTEAKVNEFDLDNQVWRLPAHRTKTGTAIDIPLPEAAVTALRELIRLGCSSPYLLPARKAQDRMLPHINENTLNVALGKVRQSLPDLEPFTIHDFRRTARTQLAALGIAPHVAERCLNHKLKGVEATYNHHDYFPERRAALNLWAQVVDACEAGQTWMPEADNVVPIRQKPSR
ncbi:MAG: tyrosine-type recombinase/integrase, partial [Methylococcus sp.]